jgi:hypothetical protein
VKGFTAEINITLKYYYPKLFWQWPDKNEEEFKSEDHSGMALGINTFVLCIVNSNNPEPYQPPKNNRPKDSIHKIMNTCSPFPISDRIEIDHHIRDLCASSDDENNYQGFTGMYVFTPKYEEQYKDRQPGIDMQGVF